MTSPSDKHQETGTDFKRLLTSEARFAPTPEVLARSDVKDYQALYDEASRDLDAFWDKIAREFTWMKSWDRVQEGQTPDARWFVGGQLNITINCLDRHAVGSRANKTALLWVGEDGEERTYSFRELLEYTCQVAHGLQSLGVKKGDRVIIYLPLTPEGIATPSELEFVAGLPKTRSGKIMRRVLKARELGVEPGDLTTIEE